MSQSSQFYRPINMVKLQRPAQTPHSCGSDDQLITNRHAMGRRTELDHMHFPWFKLSSTMASSVPCHHARSMSWYPNTTSQEHSQESMQWRQQFQRHKQADLRSRQDVTSATEHIKIFKVWLTSVCIPLLYKTISILRTQVC